MFIIRHKDTTPDENTPVLLYGYGGFSISILPSFSCTRIVFVERFRGLFCLANIRGGDEYGEAWHIGGCRANKQNCFDDFQVLENRKLKEGKRLYG